MILTDIQKKKVIDSFSNKYSKFNTVGSISDSLDLQMDGKSYQICSLVNDKLRVLFVLFDSNDHFNKETIVKRLYKKYKYDIGHSVHYQFLNDDLFDTILSDEII